MCIVGGRLVYLRDVKGVNPFNLVGAFIKVNRAVEVVKKGRCGYIAEDYELNLPEGDLSNWQQSVVEFLRKVGKRAVAKKLLGKSFNVGSLYELYTQGKISFYEFFACVCRGGIFTAGKIVLLAVVKFFAEEFYYVHKGKKSEISLFVRFVKRFFASIGVKVEDSEIEWAISSSPYVTVSEDIKGKKIIYPRDVVLKKNYVLSKLQTENGVSSSVLCASLEEALSNYRYVALIGAPGTGKTTTVVNFSKKEDRYVQCTALIGRAAQRIGGVTVHKWLGYNGKEFTSEDTYCDVLVVDECSMLTWDLLYEILTRPHGKVVFVGDPEQLPPVYGENAFDSILKYLPVVVLKKVYRGQMDVYYDKVNSLEGVYLKLKKLVSSFVEKRQQWQIIAPVYEGPVGVDSINEFIRTNFHKKGLLQERVFVNANFYDTYGRLIATNGSTGYLLQSNKDTVTVRLDTGRIVELPKRYVNEGYCMSIHKAQGSEWDYVVLVVPKEFRKTKEFIRTATTRGRIATYVVELVEPGVPPRA